jgi:hypothetical protein
LVILPGAGHSTFLDVCLPEGAQLDLCRDKAGIERAAIHRETVIQAWDFFVRTFGGPPGGQ